ncbi:MAG TPA: histidine kinase N-terminal 7TM domain-containing protein [Paludibaculum sp.]|jgi:signal transduction histidine kinase
MGPETYAFALPLYAATIGMLALCVPAWRMRREPIGGLFIAMCALTSLWPLAVGLELAATSMAWKAPLARVRPLLITMSVSSLALLVLQFTGVMKAYRRHANGVLAGGVAGVALLVALPTELGWFHHSFESSTRAPYRLVWESGRLGAVYSGYVAALTVVALGALVVSTRGRGFAYRRSVHIVLAGSVTPLLLNAMAKMHLTEWAGMNLAPLGMLAPAAAWGIALYRYGMLNLIPLGRATVLETMRDMVFILDRDGSLADCNGAALAALGSTAAVREPWSSVLRDSAVTQLEHEDRMFEVTRTPVLDAGRSEAGVVVMLHDVTEWAQARERLQAAHRLEMVGRLAGGMAHEYNNLLTVILGYTALIRESEPPGSAVRPLVAHIDEAGQKAARLTAQMLAFSRRQMLRPVLLHLDEVVVEMGNLLRQVLGNRIILTLSLAPDIGQVKVDRHQLELLLGELAINARDAMPDGGVLEIVSGLLDGAARLTVRDNGKGMDKVTRDRAFEPFFTTHLGATHTGLGLSMVHGFVLQSGGRIEIKSEEGQGTEIQIDLPVCD